MENKVTLESIAKDIRDLKILLIQNKSILTFEEACKYAGISPSYMYKITSQLPFSKPNGKKLYIAREDLDRWLLGVKRQTNDEIETKSLTYIATS